MNYDVMLRSIITLETENGYKFPEKKGSQFYQIWANATHNCAVNV